MILGLAMLRQDARLRRNRNLQGALFFLASLVLFLPLPASAATFKQRLASAQQLLENGDTEGAVAAYRALLGAVPGKQAARAQILDQLSAIETDSGDYDAVVRDATEAAAIYGALGDVRHQASSQNQVGLAQMYAGDYPCARKSLALALRLATTAGDAEARVEELLNLASVDFFTGRYSDAAAHYDEAGRAIDAHRAEEWTPRRRRILLANRATLDQRLGRYDQALASYRLALADAADVRPEEHAQMLVNLGVVYRRLGDPYKALASYDQALALFARDRQLDGELGVLKNRGIVLALDLGRLEEARATFADALARATEAGSHREALQAQLYGAETTLRLGDAASAARDFRSAHDAARALDTVEDQWKALYGLARCETLLGDEAAAAKHLREAIDVIEKIREAIRVPSLKSDFFNDKRVVFDALIALRLRQGAGAGELFDLIERGHSRGWRDRLGLRSRVDLAAVQHALPADALLLDYWTSPAGAAVVSITKTTASVRPVTVDERGIRTLTDALPRGAASAWKTAAARIASQLLPPLPDRVPHVVVVTDGALASLPFELLPERQHLLIEGHDVTYLPTAAMLLRPPDRIRRFAAPWSPRFRGFGDPLFGSAALDDPRQLRARLTGSAQEVRDIASELGGASTLYLGANDRKKYLDDKAAPPLLHIASHAFVDPGAIEQSRILFSADASAPGRSGPAGYLFLKEAYELPLSGVELAVLSACDTERGKQLAGEGIESFSRAFLAAGARSTVTTLWRVPDGTTAAFMRLFYHHLQRGASRAEALRLAKLRFLKSASPTNDPHYWAAFVLTGDGLRPVSTALRWRSVALAGAGIGALLVIVFVLRRPAPKHT
jgi:CHAT domain-containing protein/tetratricopeptide (TPR) repeat protein